MGHVLPIARRGVIRNSINRLPMINAALPRPALARVAVVAAMALAAWCAAAVVPAALARSAPDISPLAARPAAARPAAGPAAARPGAARPSSARPSSGRPGAALLAHEQGRRQARALLRLLRQDSAAWAKCTAATCAPGLLPAARDLAATQEAQALEYYCGPATVAEMLAQVGRHVSQATVARELGTGPAGTNWADDASDPVPDVLNANQGKNNYVPVALPAVPAGAQVREFEADLVADLNHAGGVPLAGNAYEVAGGPHLAGNPVNQTIFHWFDIRGYQDFGAVTDYEDSVHGASSIGWSAGVPAYSSLSSAVIVAILGGRGYAW
jgi:hypothetical protein